jgi:hypothetical protein
MPTVVNIPVALSVPMIISIVLPLFAAAVLTLLPAALPLVKRISQEEYDQAARAPAWLIVLVGAALFLLGAYALGHWTRDTSPIYLGLTLERPALMIDAYSLWCTLLLGALLAVGAWVPGARRSLVPHTLWPAVLTLGLAWGALLTVHALHLDLLLLGWGGLLLGCAVLWAWLLRPRWQLAALEVLLVLALALVLSVVGLLWLRGLANGASLDHASTQILSAPPRAVSAALLCTLLGMVGPAFYLPWWLWARRDEGAMLWMPAALLTAGAGPLALVRLLYAVFPARSTALLQLTGMEQLTFITRLLWWLNTWGLLALLVGAGWMVWLVVRRSETAEGLRPLAVVAPGLLLIGLAGGLHAAGGTGVAGMLWLQLTWVAVTGVWVAGNGLLPALAPSERTERGVVQTAQLLALAALVAVPFTAGYHGLVPLVGALNTLHTPLPLLVLCLVVTAVCSLLLLPRWLRVAGAATPRPGAGWGILGPFTLAILLTFAGLLAVRLTPLFALITASLLQAY